MNAESVNRWLTLGANVGILIGIMLLLLELEQNSTMMRGQTRNEVSSELINLMSQVVENRDIAELIDRANSGEELTPVESIQYEHREVDGNGQLVALDRKSGRVKWKSPRPKLLSWSSPVVAKVAGRDQLLISGCELVASYDPNSGRPLWSTKATTQATCGTMIWDGKPA